MEPKVDLSALQIQIENIKDAILELQQLGGAMPCVYRNTARMLASLKMLELNVIDMELSEVSI